MICWLISNNYEISFGSIDFLNKLYLWERYEKYVLLTTISLYQILYKTTIIETIN